MARLSFCGLLVAAALVGACVAHINEASDGDKSALIAENRVPKAPAPADTAVEFGSVCDECETIMKRVVEVADDPTKMAELKFLLSALCHETSYEEECKMFVSKLDYIIRELKPFLHDPKRICRELHLCNNPSLELFHRVGLLYAKKYVNKAAGAADLICEECQFAAHELSTNFVDNTAIQADIRRFLTTNVCAHLGSAQGACVLIVDDYLPDLFAKLHELLEEPREFCEHIALCKATAKSALTAERALLAGTGKSAGAWRELGARMSAHPLHNKANFGAASCIGCHLFFGTLLEQLANAKTTTAIGGDIRNAACPILPKNWLAGCKDFLNLYAPTVVLMTVKQFDQYQVCDALHVCERQTAAKALDLKSIAKEANIECTLCTEIARNVEYELASTEMRSRLTDEAARFVCERAPGGLRYPCDDLVRGIVPLALTRLLQRLHDQSLCRAIHACA